MKTPLARGGLSPGFHIHPLSGYKKRLSWCLKPALYSRRRRRR